jgi:hypothetical protein
MFARILDMCLGNSIDVMFEIKLTLDYFGRGLVNINCKLLHLSAGCPRFQSFYHVLLFLLVLINLIALLASLSLLSVLRKVLVVLAELLMSSMEVVVLVVASGRVVHNLKY